MENHFKKYYSEIEWLLEEENSDSELQQTNESIYTLGNGYIGSRGVYEEMPLDSLPGTFFAGIFEESKSKVAELINAPNPFFLSIELTKNEKLNLSQMKFTHHQRILDLKKGFLTRHTIFQNKNNELFDYQSMRFISNDKLNIAMMQVKITPLTKAADFFVDARIDTQVRNHGIILEKNCQDFTIDEECNIGTLGYLSVNSLDGEKRIAFGQEIFVTMSNNDKKIPNNQFALHLEKDHTATITKMITFHAARKLMPRRKLKAIVTDCLENVSEKSFEQIFQDHAFVFENKWKNYDIQIAGDSEIQSALRLNLYHILIANHVEVTDVSVGAKLLTGEGYKGHIFWEAELLMLPCYLYSEPILARQLLEYRFNRLRAAKQNATDKGFKGALFPWESAASGKEETPSWTEDLDGTIKIVHTGHQSLHINVAIFYGLSLYFWATSDVEFMLEKGIVMMIEMARFWKSRVVYNKKLDTYKIKNVMGPDEFHDSLNNNAYTNYLVAWSLEKTISLLKWFHETFPEETNQILKNSKFYSREKIKIEKIAKHMWIPQHDKIMPQFDNYLKLKELRTPSLDVFGLPQLPSDFLVIDLYKTQFIKQADVVLLLFLLPKYFEKKLVETNFHFYEPRTLHKSSWSAPIYSGVAAQIDCNERAYHYLKIALDTDKKDIFRNAHQGVHTPAIGGAWVSLVFGFCGVRVLEGKLSITPHLPELWRSVSFQFHYLDFLIKVNISQIDLRITLENAKVDWLFNSGKRKPIPSALVEVGGEVIEMMPGPEYVIPLDKRFCSYK